MAEPFNPHGAERENPDLSSPAAAEEEEGDGAPGGGLPVLKWFKGDTGADTPAGYVTMWADFFLDGNLRLPLTVFVAEVLKWYKIHISQLSSFEMIRVRNFEYTFCALVMEPVVEDFWRFYQLKVNTGFFSFGQRHGSTKLMTPPKGITKWKTKFFYIKAAAVVAKMTFRNVNETILTESIDVPRADTVDWFPRLRTIEFKKLDNSQLWVLRMMLGRTGRKARQVVREKSEDTALWRIFDADFKGKVETLACAEGEKGFNLTIRDNFRIPDRDAMKAPLPQGKDFDAKGAPKKQVEKTVRGRQRKKHEPAVVPPLVLQGAGISPTCFRRYTDYVLVSDTLEALGVPGGGAAVGGSSACSKPAGEKKKRKVEEKAAGAGEQKRPRLQTKRTTAVSQPKPAVVAEPQDGGFSLFDAPTSPAHDAPADAGVNKEFTKSPSFEAVTDPSVQAEDVGDKTADQIFDTVDSHDNLIPTKDNLNLKFADAEKQKSLAAKKASGSASGGMGFEEPSIQSGESELEFYYRTYTENRGVNYHRPPWSVMQGDDISNDPSACKEILGCLGTPFEFLRARGLPCVHRINQLSSMLVGSSIIANDIMEDYKVLGLK
ncbi:hypothetical protein HanRHA438_Chr13g0603351 [Helianthus annuus]|nr:hypothetical protein HanRHA438_Chr13g0603351 [Helianthus annuus]